MLRVLRFVDFTESFSIITGFAKKVSAGWPVL